MFFHFLHIDSFQILGCTGQISESQGLGESGWMLKLRHLTHEIEIKRLWNPFVHPIVKYVFFQTAWLPVAQAEEILVFAKKHIKRSEPRYGETPPK